MDRNGDRMEELAIIQILSLAATDTLAAHKDKRHKDRGQKRKYDTRTEDVKSTRDTRTDHKKGQMTFWDKKLHVPLKPTGH